MADVSSARAIDHPFTDTDGDGLCDFETAFNILRSDVVAGGRVNMPVTCRATRTDHAQQSSEGMETSEALRSEEPSRAREDEAWRGGSASSSAAHLEADALTETIRAGADASAWVRDALGNVPLEEPARGWTFDPSPIRRHGGRGGLDQRRAAIERACAAAVVFLQSVPLARPDEVRSRALMLRAMASGVLELWPDRRAELLEPVIAQFERGQMQLPGEGKRIWQIASLMRSAWCS